MVSEQDIFTYLKWKSVLILGNANYIGQENYSEFIEDFDVVVRFNKSGPTRKTSDKFEIWCTGIMNEREQFEAWRSFKRKPNYVMAFREDVPSIPQILPIMHKVHDSHYASLKHVFGGVDPSTGAAAIEWFVSRGIKPSLLGFDSFATKTVYHKYKMPTTHSSKLESQYLSDLQEAGKVLIYDRT